VEAGIPVYPHPHTKGYCISSWDCGAVNGLGIAH